MRRFGHPKNKGGHPFGKCSHYAQSGHHRGKLYHR